MLCPLLYQHRQIFHLFYRRRSRLAFVRWLMSITDPPASAFHLKHQTQGCLMIKRALLVGITQALVDQAQVEASALGFFNWT